jgi:hypothetical protein
MNAASGDDGQTPASVRDVLPADWLNAMLKSQASADVAAASDDAFTRAVLRALPHRPRRQASPRWLGWAACIAAQPPLGLWMVVGVVFGLIVQGLVTSLSLPLDVTTGAAQHLALLIGLPVMLSAWLLWWLVQGHRWLE